VAVVETDDPAGNAPEPDQDVATHLDVSADTEVTDPTEISVEVQVSTLASKGITPPTEAAILHYANGNWTELDTDVTIRGGTATLTATTQYGLSPFAIAEGEQTTTEPNEGSPGGGGAGGAANFITEERAVTERLPTGPTRSVTIDFGQAISGAVDVEPIDGLPAGADASGPVVGAVDVSVPESATDQGATVELTVDRTAVDAVGADASDIGVVHYDDGRVETLPTDVESVTEDTVTLSADASSFSPFAVVVQEEVAAETTTPAGATTPTPGSTPTAEPTSTPPAEDGATPTAGASGPQEPVAEGEPAAQGTPVPPSEPGGFGLAGLLGAIALVVLSITGVTLYRRRIQ
jgi:hypothetical protein